MVNYRVVNSIQEIEDYLGNAKVVAFDFECSPNEGFREEKMAALDPHKAEITGVSFSVEKETAIYVPFHHRVGINADFEETLKYLTKKVFKNRDVIKVAHNLAYEAMFLYKHGIVVQEPVYDTIVASMLTLKDNYEFRKLIDSGLKTLVPQLYGEELPHFADVVGERHFDELDSTAWDTIRYACADSDWTLQLYHTFNKWFDSELPRHRWICEKIESPTAVYTGMMKYNGVGVDIETMEKKKADADKRLAELHEDIKFIVGDIDIGANCGTQAFKDYLFKDLGLPILKTTAKYAEAADDETMQLLTEYCRENRPELIQLFDLVAEYRKWAKINSTYLDGYLKQVNSVSKRIHPDLMPMGTDTGRFASRRPNLQNMPRKGTDPIGIRNCIIAKPGTVFLDFDFSQIELRVGAHYCKDEKMIETYKQGGDIHAQTASVVFGLPMDVVNDKSRAEWKEQRTIAKNCNFGVFFGLFAKGLQRTLKFKGGVEKTEAECKEIIYNLKNGYPELARWQADTIYQAKRDKFSETAFGRRRYLRGINSPDWGVKSYNERCSLNTPIQGTAAEILKLAMARLVRELEDNPHIRPILQIHDELLFEVDENYLESAIGIIKAAMERKPFEDFELPIIAEGETGTKFGAMEELK